MERIEGLFAEIDSGVKSLEAAQRALDHYRRSLLKAAFEGRLTEAWRAANPDLLETPDALLARIRRERETRHAAALAEWEAAVAEWETGGRAGRKPGRLKKRDSVSTPTADERSLAPIFPSEWATTNLGNALWHLTSGSRDWKSFYDRGHSTFVMAQNVRSGHYDGSYRQAVDAPDEDASADRTRIRQKDLLITIVGANTADICIFPFDVDDHYVCQSVALLRLIESKYADFIARFLQVGAPGRDILEHYAYGAGRPHLSFDDLERVVVPLCSPAEQAEIVCTLDARLSGADALAAEIDAGLARAVALRQSILVQAFAGKLVPQDPADEPASALLARIRAERAAAKPKRPRKAPA